MSWLSNAAVVVTAVGFISNLYGDISHMGKYLLEILIIALITFINLFGIAATGKWEMFLTALKMLPLLLLPIISLFFIDYSTLELGVNSSSLDFFGSLQSVIFYTIWAFIGLECITVPSGQVSTPKKTIPRAIIFGTLVAAVVYILGYVTISSLVPQATLLNSAAPYADLAAIVFGGSWGTPIAIAGLLTMLGTYNGWTLIAARIPQAAARDGYFPKIFTKTNKSGTPHYSVIISSLLTLTFITITLDENLVNQFTLIISASITVIIFIYIMCVFAYFKLLKRDSELNYKNLTLITCGLVFCLIALTNITLQWLFIAATLVLTGTPMRFWLKKGV
jgi:APA family basic amino acid/polyamine antiporter